MKSKKPPTELPKLRKPKLRVANPIGDTDSPIRRIKKGEQDVKRQWPQEKHLASNQDVPMPPPGQKNRIHSMLVSLPVLMLMIGLFVYMRGESAQINGEPIVADMVSRTANFKSLSKVSGIGKTKHYLWYIYGENSRGVRVKSKQAQALSGLTVGDELMLELTPTVEGSNTLWAYRITHDGNELVSPQ